MSAPTENDFNFILCCLKHSPEKPNFHAVAAELGLPKHMTAYHRHWNIMKKAGITGNTGKGRKPGAGGAKANGNPTRGKKRAKPVEEEEEEKGGEEEKPDTKDANDGEAEELETPKKKVKLAAGEEVEDEDETEVKEELT